MLDFFFFQAEDGIRALTVTGVQTCALPIWRIAVSVLAEEHQGVAALFRIPAPDLAQAKPLAKEPQRGRQVAHADHGVEVAHGAEIALSWRHERAQRPRQLSPRSRYATSREVARHRRRAR